MKKLLFVFIAVLLLIGCKNEEKKTDSLNEDKNTAETENPETDYPKSLATVFSAHGGMQTWKQMNNLCFEVRSPNGLETHTVSLPDRKVKIETEDWSMGYDGSNVWLLENEENAYEGDPMFYHNLMFYFYAVPYVFGDDGINYSNGGTMELDGETYSVTNISYDSGVGNSPKDQYKIFTNPETNKMEWLAYTVTYNTGQASDDWKYIKYDRWTEVNGITMPEKITWYNVENNMPKGEKSDVVFKNVALTETVLEDNVFKKPAKAVVIR